MQVSAYLQLQDKVQAQVQLLVAGARIAAALAISPEVQIDVFVLTTQWNENFLVFLANQVRRNHRIQASFAQEHGFLPA